MGLALKALDTGLVTMTSERAITPCQVLALTGTCGAGKSTIAELLARQRGWLRVSEDAIWPARFGRNRGAFGTEEHRRKRAVVQREVLEHVRAGLAAGHRLVLDATVHDAPPEALHEYDALFAQEGVSWRLCVLHPRLEVAIARDAGRVSGSIGAGPVASLYAKFTGAVIPRYSFLDTSEEAPDSTLMRVLAIAGWQDVAV